ncbi:MAG: chitobiase/beta-hexosaminidase C-terminal domain-containing protein, partial [Deferrisomatales bacterium]
MRQQRSSVGVFFRSAVAGLLLLLGLASPGPALAAYHSADYQSPQDWKINLSELLRVIQLYNLGEYSCGTAGIEEGFTTGATGGRGCTPHSSDYNPQDWKIGLSELRRVHQLYNLAAYHEDAVGEDGFEPGPAPAVSFAVAGLAFDGPLAGATVTVTRPDGTLLATGTTGANGSFSVGVTGAYVGPVVVRVSGGTDLGPDGVAGGGDDTENRATFEDVGVGAAGATVAANPSPLSTLVRGRLGDTWTPVQVGGVRAAVATLLGVGEADLAADWGALDATKRIKLRKLAALEARARALGVAGYLRSLGQNLQDQKPLFDAANADLLVANLPEAAGLARNQAEGALEALSVELLAGVANRVTVGGRVLRFGSDLPVAGARVEATGKEGAVLAGDDGVYSMTLAAGAGEELKFLISAPGYAPNQRVVTAPGGQAVVTLDVRLKAVDAEATVDASAGLVAGRLARFEQGDLVLGSRNGAFQVVIPGASLGRAVGRLAANGGTPTYKAYVTYGDPSREREIFPGSFRASDPAARQALERKVGRAAFSGAADEVPLESVVFLNVDLRDANDLPVDATFDPPMDVRLRIPENLQARYKAQYERGDRLIPWYSYSEARGMWVRESQAALDLVDGVVYAQAQSSHFSWWNVDWPIVTHAILEFEVRDGVPGNPVPGVGVRADGRDYEGASEGTTGQSGVAVLRVRKDARLRVSMTDRPADAQEVNTGATPDRTDTIDGQPVPVYKVGFVRQRVSVTGTVAWTGGGPIAGAEVTTHVGGRAVTGAAGDFSVEVPYGSSPIVTATYRHRDPVTGDSVTLRARRTVNDVTATTALGTLELGTPGPVFVTLRGVARIRTVQTGQADVVTAAARAWLRIDGYETWCDGAGNYAVRVPERVGGVGYVVEGTARGQFDLRLPVGTTVGEQAPDVEFRQEFARVQGFVELDDGSGVRRPAAGAQVWTDSGATAPTDARGYYEVAVPRGRAGTVDVRYFDPLTGRQLTDRAATSGADEVRSFLFSIPSTVTVRGTVKFGTCPAGNLDLLTYEQKWARVDAQGNYEVQLQRAASQKLFLLYTDGEGNRRTHEEVLDLSAAGAEVTRDIVIQGFVPPPVLTLVSGAPDTVVAGAAWSATLRLEACGTPGDQSYTLTPSWAGGAASTPVPITYVAGVATLEASVAVPADAAEWWYEVRLRVAEGATAVLSQSFGFYVRPGEVVNRPPVVSDLRVSPAVLRPGAAAEAVVSAWDPDRDALTFDWYLGAAATPFATGPAARASLLTAGLTGGKYPVRVVVKDGRGGEATRTAEFTVDAAPPVLSVTPAGGTYGTPRLVTLTANEPAAIHYTLDGTAPTVGSPRYGGSIPIAETATLSFFGVDLVGNSSAVRTELYNIDSSAPPSFDLARDLFTQGFLPSTHRVLRDLEALGQLGDNGRALSALTTALMAMDEARDAASPFYALLDGLGLKLVGTTLGTYDLLGDGRFGLGDGMGPAPGTAPVDGRAAAQALLTKVKAAQALLAAITGPVGFTVVRDGFDAEVDDADVRVFGAALALAEFQLEYGLAYDLAYRQHDNPGPDTSAKNLTDLLLRADSAAYLGRARAAFLRFLAEAEAAVEAMKGESDDQRDDLLTLPGEVLAHWGILRDGLRAAAAAAAAP